jgi:hypothetical protein
MMPCTKPHTTFKYKMMKYFHYVKEIKEEAPLFERNKQLEGST